MGAWDWLFGSAEAAQVKPGQFGPSRPFPTQDDLQQARDADAFRYTGETSPRTFQAKPQELGPVRGITAPTDVELASKAAKAILPMAEANKFDPVTDPDLVDVLARNKLAAHRSGIVSVGEGGQDNVVQGLGFSVPNIAGTTIESYDEHPPGTVLGYQSSGFKIPSTATHEAAHRGLYHIRDDIEGMPNSPELTELRDALNDPRDNELMVRLLMNRVYGDPERARLPTQPYDIPQFLDDPSQQGERDRIGRLNSLAETLAQKMVQRRKPGGPF